MTAQATVGLRSGVVAGNARPCKSAAVQAVHAAIPHHGLWNKGKDEARLRFIQTGAKDLTVARLALVKAVAFVVASGLQVFGVAPAEEMRA